MTTDAPLLITREDGVMTLTLNRPQARNALNLALARALKASLLEFECSAEMRVAVVTGSDPAFCAGLDLKDFSSPDAPRHEVAAMIDMWSRLRKPVIAAVNGAAMTGALELALGCDFIVASQQARFGDTHTQIGALAGGGMGARLPHAVGARWAKQMSFTGTPIDAATARRIGLVNEVVTHAELLPHVTAMARRIATMNPELLSTVKRVIDSGGGATLAPALLMEKDALAERKARGPMAWAPAPKPGTP